MKIQTIVVIFGFLGIHAEKTTRYYSMSFYLIYLEERGLNLPMGSCVNLLNVLSSTVTPFFLTQLKSLLPASFVKRYAILVTVNALLTLMLGAIDFIPSSQPALIFSYFGMIRVIQGIFGTMLMIAAMGEILDILPLADSKNFIIMTMVGVYVACIDMPDVAVYLYSFGGFLLPSAVVAVVSLSALIPLPYISTLIENKDECVVLLKDADDKVEKTPDTASADELHGLEKVVYYIPDCIAFLQNALYNGIIYALPLRLKRFNNIDEKVTTWITTLGLVMSILSSLALTLLPTDVDIIALMLFACAIFHASILLSFGYTTSTLNFMGGIYIGYVGRGVTDPFLVSLTVVSKFYIYKIFGKSISGISENVSRIYATLMNMGAFFGGIAAGFSTERSSEDGVFLFIGMSFFSSCAGFTFCLIYLIIRKRRGK